MHQIVKSNEELFKLKSDLIDIIHSIYSSGDLNKTQFSLKVGLTQPRTSNLLNRKAEEFSLDAIVGCFIRLGYVFEPKFKNGSIKIGVTKTQNKNKNNNKSDRSESSSAESHDDPWILKFLAKGVNEDKDVNDGE